LNRLRQDLSKANGIGQQVLTDLDYGSAFLRGDDADWLDAAKAGKSFTPPTTTPTEGKSMAKPEGKTMAKPMHHHHHMPAKKPADAGAPADSGTPPAPAPDSTPK